MENRAQMSFIEAAGAFKAARAAVDVAETDAAQDEAIARCDEALDVFLGVPSPSPKAYGEKVRMLEQEYGLNAQPRHLAALYADARILD